VELYVATKEASALGEVKRAGNDEGPSTGYFVKS
jgi:hypothetical protein